MSSDKHDRLERFLTGLRRESTRGPGHGLGRFARLLRGGAGLASGVLSSSRRGAEATLDENDWRRLEALVTRLGELKGLPMKAGQIMSTLELDLPEEARRLLGLLQTQSPATPFDQVEAMLHEDLGPRAAALLAGLEREPVSIASVGQVYRARLPDGTLVAVKVRHPGIEQAIHSDLRGAVLGTGLAGTLLPGMAATAREFVAETQARFLEECDYALEAERQQLFAAFFCDHPILLVPAVFPAWSGPRVLTSRWESGESRNGARSCRSRRAC
jgi:predicted unusual protein kinase regulating ubiquinone biosynthesis (AarF/ABC1/UbiB family)